MGKLLIQFTCLTIHMPEKNFFLNLNLLSQNEKLNINASANTLTFKY